MPLIQPSTYHPPFFLAGSRRQTLFPPLFRRLPDVRFQRERLELADGDFLDLDWARQGSPRLAVISYGMESDPQRPYIRGMVRAVRAAGWDALVWNYRGCGGEPNRRIHFYHSGMIQDLDAVVQHTRAGSRYERLAVVGFSLGGNLLLNYLGRRADQIPAELDRAVAISAPCDVWDCALQLRRPENRFYVRRFLDSFREKVRAKMRAMPGQIDDRAFATIRTLEEYDEVYTIPHFGYASVPDFYRAVSSKPVLGRIRVPTLLINAQDDSFIGPASMPVEEARTHPNLFLERPASGGHLGFVTFGQQGWYWSEQRTVAFLNQAR